MAVMRKRLVPEKHSAIFTLLSWIIVCMVADYASAAVTAGECRADYGELVSEIEMNRDKSLKEIRVAIAEASDNRIRSALEHELESVWEEEETQRNQASAILLDCLRAAKAADKSAG